MRKLVTAAVLSTALVAGPAFAVELKKGYYSSGSWSIMVEIFTF